MRILNGVFIAVFMTMLTLPLIFVDLSSDRVSIRENRMLAQFPRLADIKSHPGGFIRDFDAWFKDSTGFRDRLVTLYNAIDKNWHNTVWYKEGQLLFLVGEQGHHYSVAPGQIQKFQGKQVLSDDQLKNMAVKLDELKKHLDGKGIPLVVMLCTDKETIYPEFYPKVIRRGPEPVQLDIITRYLQEHTTVDVFNIRQALLAEKNNYLLYPQVDNWASAPRNIAHYNEIGGFFAYRDLMKHVNIYFPEIIPYELNDVDIHYDRVGTPDVSLKKEIVYKKLDKSFFNDVTGYRYFSNEYEAYENTEFDLPVILFFLDSYGSEHYIGKYIANHFGKTITIHWRNTGHIKEYIDRYKPDIVVFESAERELRGFANSVAGIPKLQ